MRLSHGFIAILSACFLLTSQTQAQDADFRIGIPVIGTLKYKPGFQNFDYVNPNAPKGGTLNLSASGTFDTFNPVPDKGVVASGLDIEVPLYFVYETLLKKAEDELSSSYGLLAEGISYPADYTSATFRLRAEARWADGQPVTPEDVIFSLEKWKELNPRYSIYYKHVVKAEKTGEREITFRFDEKNNKELPAIVGELPIVPQHWWTAKGPDGQPRDIAKTTLEPVMGSGPYALKNFQAGSTVSFELRDDYWGKNIPVNIGQNNFRTIKYSYFTDRNVAFEAFRAGSIDFWIENEAKRWATGYDFPALKQGHVKREEVENPYRSSGVMVGFIPNTRRDQFKDPKLRLALNYAFDFEDANRTIFFNNYKRIDSYFYGSPLASAGLPQGEELEILNEFKDKLPAFVFTSAFENPVGGDPSKQRQNLRKAIELAREAGFEIKNGRMTDTKTNKPLVIEILLDSPTIERVALPYAQSLRKIGIDAKVRTVDDAQYTNRVRSFDYDMIYNGWAQSINPGNEQAEYWGSNAAKRQGSKNYAGISDPVIDAIVRKVIFAEDRALQEAAIKALDRVLLAGNYIVPSYTLRAARIAYWDRFARPAEYPQYGLGFPDIWWAKSAQ